MLRTLAAAALATSVVALAAPASAQERTRGEAGGDTGGRRPMGLRFELGWGESLNLATIGGDLNTGNNVISPNGDIKIGYDIGQFTPLIGISFLTNSQDTAVEPEETSESVTFFVLDIEGRYYLAQHRRGLQPFIFGEFSHAFASLGQDPEPEGDGQDELDDQASALDFTEINAGLGMEYKFDGAAFAIGGKWGLGLAFQGRDAGEESLGNTTIGTVAGIYAAWRM